LADPLNHLGNAEMDPLRTAICRADAAGFVRLEFRWEFPPPGVRCVSETATMLADWLKGHAARAVLVRPDRYAYGVASDAAGLHALLASLDAQLR
jgi:hypothetical protein